jgi:cell division inhibitor SepF
MFEEFAKKMKKKRDAEEVPPFKAFVDKITEEEVSEPAPAPVSAQASTVVTNSESSSNNLELKVIAPESFADAFAAAGHLMNGCTVFLNVENLDDEMVQRMLDFLRGVCFAIQGDVKSSSKNTYIITPSNISVSDK